MNACIIIVKGCTKMKLKTINVVSVVILLILSGIGMLFGSAGIHFDETEDAVHSSDEGLYEVSPIPTSEKIERDPFRIDSDLFFAAMADQEGWPGDGSEDDPYIIEGYDIDGEGYGYCIYIGNTTVHFIIKDNSLQGADGGDGSFYSDSGVIFYNVQNGVVEENAIFWNQGSGVSLSESINNTVNNNHMFYNNKGIVIYLSESNIITNNVIESSSSSGITILFSSNNVIKDGNIFRWNPVGLEVSYSQNNVVEYNTFFEENIGIGLYEGDLNTIRKNTFRDNYEDGIEIGSSVKNTIYHNEFLNSSAHNYGNNKWDNGYPSGGNYWSDYSGYDDYSGPNQDEPGSDGIGDEEYLFAGGGVDAYPLYSPPIQGRVQRPPIRIDSDEDFISNNGVSGGQGTEEDPYIIEDYYIEAERGYCIYIGNTTKFFKLRNNDVSNALGYIVPPYITESAIQLYNVTNGLVEENIAFSSGYGIRLGKSSEVDIVGNQLFSNTYGILFDESTESLASENNATDNSKGLFIYHSNDNILTDNLLQDNDDQGIWLDSSSDNTISFNNASHNQKGIDLESSSTNTISMNEVWGNTDGIGLYSSSSYNNVINNTIGDNTWNGLIIKESIVNSIRENDVRNNQYGIQCYLWSNWNVISENTVTSSKHGIWIRDSSNENTLTLNEISLCEDGIRIYDSVDTFTESNSIFNCDYGIKLSSANENTIYRDSCWDNGYGIHLLDSDHNELERNEGFNNSNVGILLESSQNNVVHNNTADGNGNHGIWLNGAQSNTVTSNTVANNGMVGIFISDTSSNLLMDNTVMDNDWYGIRLWETNDNTIYHNRFIDNDDQASDNGNNAWDNGYPSGGNYWSDHTGPDEFRGPEQDEHGSDGVVDDPYVISGGGNQDDYPLTSEPLRLTYTLELFSHPESNGWQFVSFSIIPDNIDLLDILSSIEGSYDRSMYYDAGQESWFSYLPDRPEHFNDFNSWDHTMGVWIRMIEDNSLNLNGRAPSRTSIPLEPGWNMVGYPSSTDRVPSYTLPNEVTKVGVFDASRDYNIEYVNLNTYIMTDSYRYWVYNSADEQVIWTLEY